MKLWAFRSVLAVLLLIMPVLSLIPFVMHFEPFLAASQLPV